MSTVQRLQLALGIVMASATLAFAAQSPAPSASPRTAMPPLGIETFDTAQLASAAVIKAASTFDQEALLKIFGDGVDVVLTGELERDRQRAADFATQAAEKNHVVVDAKSGTRAVLHVGNEDWPFPVPIVQRGGKWIFDTEAGRRELKFRRIGENELDAIEVCRGYVEAQQEYSLGPRAGSTTAQYAQRIISTPGKQDGLAWQEADGTWAGPVGESIAHAIEEGYKPGAESYHGYVFKILKGQGPAARLGQMDYVIKGVMIGGFALVAAPAEYGVTGFKTFMVSYDGVVYERDFGIKTTAQFRQMERFNPDKSWSEVPE